jgi:hypothetical protein
MERCADGMPMKFMIVAMRSESVLDDDIDFLVANYRQAMSDQPNTAIMALTFHSQEWKCVEPIVLRWVKRGWVTPIGSTLFKLEEAGLKEVFRR